MKKPELQHGIYRHYKGETYQVIDVVLHTETQDWMVLYQAYSYSFQDKQKGEVLFVRPFTMFVETISIKSEVVKRFEYIRNT